MRQVKGVKVPREMAEAALKALFGNEVCIEEADHEQRRWDIDFVLRTGDGREATIDLKTRRPTHNLLVVEVAVFNNQRRKPWIYHSRADYFLFAHYSEKEAVGQFYLISRPDIVKLVEQIEPISKHTFIYKITDVSLLYFYEYEAVKAVGKLYHVTVRGRGA